MRINRLKLVVELTKRNITQKELAELAGVSRPTVSGIKNGKSCSEQTAKKIADALHADLKQLVEK